MNNIYNIKQTLSHVKNSLGKVLSVAVASFALGANVYAYNTYNTYYIDARPADFSSVVITGSDNYVFKNRQQNITLTAVTAITGNNQYVVNSPKDGMITFSFNFTDQSEGQIKVGFRNEDGTMYRTIEGVGSSQIGSNNCINVHKTGWLWGDINDLTYSVYEEPSGTKPTVRAGVAPVITAEGVTVNAYLALPGCYNGNSATVSKITAYYKLGSTPSTSDAHVDLTTGTFSQGSLHNIKIPAASLETGTYHVKFTATNEFGESELSDEICFAWSSTCTEPTVIAQPSAEAAAYCQGAEATALSVTASGTAPITYQWYSNKAASTSTGTLIAGATSSSYTPSTAEAGTLYYYCVVTGCNAQTATSEVSGAVTVEATPSLTSVDGPTVLCATAENTGTYTTQYVEGATYTWRLSSNNLTGSSNSNSITVTTTGVAGAEYVEVYASSSAGCKSEVVRADITLESGSSIDAGTISGNTEVCSGSTVTYNNSSPNGTVFNWSVPDGWTIASGQGTNQIKVKVGTSGGYVGVSVSNSCGGAVPAPNYAVTVLRTPTTPESITGNATVCKNVEYTYSTPDNGAEEYIWKLPAGWSASCTADKTTIKAVPGPNAVSGNIKVKAKSDCGESEYYSMAVTVNGATLEISGVGAKSASATYPWQPMVLTTIPDNVEVDWSYTYSTTLSETSTVFVANGNSATLKSGAPVSDTEHYTVTATTRSAVAGCQTSASYDVYISSDIAEVCAK